MISNALLIIMLWAILGAGFYCAIDFPIIKFQSKTKLFIVYIFCGPLVWFRDSLIKIMASIRRWAENK
jgi:hypothetical protein